MSANELCGFHGILGDEEETDTSSGYAVLGAGASHFDRKGSAQTPPKSGAGAGHFDRKGSTQNKPASKKGGTGNPPAVAKRPPPTPPISKSAAAKKHPYHASAAAAKSAKRAVRASLKATKPSKRIFKEVSVRGIFGDAVILGAPTGGAIVTKKLTAKQKLSVQKYNAAVKKVAAADASAKKAGATAMAVAKKVAEDIKKTPNVVKIMMAKQTKMKGLEEVLGSDYADTLNMTYEEIVGCDYEDIVGKYCSVTGADAVTVFGGLAAHAVSCGYDPKALSVLSLISDSVASELGDYEEIMGVAAGDAARAAQVSAISTGRVAPVACDGACACPNCGASLRLVLAPPPSVSPGQRAGDVVVTAKKRSLLGAVLDAAADAVFGAAAAPAFRAGSRGSCVCRCPSCKCVICLHVGREGYDCDLVQRAAPKMYEAAAQAVHGEGGGIESLDEEITVFGLLSDEDEDMIEVFGLDANGNAPGMPGYDPTTDAASGSYSSETDPEAGQVEEEVKDEVIQAPAIDTPIQNLPPDAVPYNGEKGWPSENFGSYMYFHGPQTGLNRGGGLYGYVWGWNWYDEIPNYREGQPVDKGFLSGIIPTHQWTCVSGMSYVYDDPSKSGSQMYPNAVIAPNDGAKVSALSLAGKTPAYKDICPEGKSCGPLIGHPGTTFKNLRWAIKDQKWFWFLNEAPDWATEEARYIAASLLKAAKVADDAAKAAEEADKAKEKAANDAVIAQQQMEEDLAEQAEASRSRIEESQRAGQEAQLAIDERKAEAEARRADAEAARQAAAAEMEYAKQQAVIQQQAQQAQLEIEKRQIDIDLQRQQAQIENPQQEYQPQYNEYSGPQYQEGPVPESSPFEDYGPDPFADGGETVEPIPGDFDESEYTEEQW